MNHVQLRTFHAVASYGSFTRAALSLNISQPTLSAQVKGLEEQYSVKLFERHGRGVKLTALGERLYLLTQRKSRLEAEAERLLGAAGPLTGGHLRIGADAPYHVIPLMAGFSRSYPEVKVSIAFGNSEQLIADLLERRCEVAVLPMASDDRRFYCTALRPDRLVVIINREHGWASRRSIFLHELSEQCLIRRETGSATRAVFEQAMLLHDVQPRSSLEIGSREGVREAVAAGLGVGVVSASELGNDRRLRALDVRDAKLEMVEYATCLLERLPLRPVQAFLQLAEQTDLTV